MKLKKFEELSLIHFGKLLRPERFENHRSNHCSFYRQVSDDVFHLIVPDLNGAGTWFDINVFATSSLINPNFESVFPDDLGMPSGIASLLHSKFGVGTRRQSFRCNYEEGFIRNFNKDVVSAVRDKALPHLDGIKTLNDLIPFINNDFFLGAALWHTGDQKTATEILIKEKLRLSQIVDDTGRVAADLKYIERLIES